MTLASTHLNIEGPDEFQTQVPLPETEDILVIGRDRDCSVCLPSSDVSRSHCKIVKEDPIFWKVTDTSKNGTTLVTEYNDRIDLQDIPDRSVFMRAGDKLLIPTQPIFTITLIDPNQTRDRSSPGTQQTEMQYIVDLDRQMLCHYFRGKQWDVKKKLRALAHKLLLYMAEKNWEKAGETIFSREELIEAVWKNEGSETELNKLIKEIRDLSDGNLIETRKGIGYALKAKAYRK